MAEKNYSGTIINESGEIIRKGFSPIPLTSEQEEAKRRLDEEAKKLTEAQDAEPEAAPLTEEEEAVSLHKRLALRESLIKKSRKTN